MSAASEVVLLVRARHVQRSLENASAPFALMERVLPGGQPSLFSRHVATLLPDAELQSGPAWELRAVPPTAVDALRLAISVQLAAANAPRAPGDSASAFQPVVLVCTPAEQVSQDVWTAALAAAGAAGGQVLWTKAALDIVDETPAASLYSWEARGGSLGFHECIYDNRLSLLDPPFERMFTAEIEEWVGPRREGQSERAYGRAGLPSPTRPAVANDLYGIALSGGGMRSATFSLGVLQALSQHDLLEPADYLSTVSGGGYVGISFSGLCAEELPYEGLDRLGADEHRFPFGLARSELGDDGTQAASPVHGNETPALWHVRKYANLIAGGFGLLSLATWQLVGRYFVSTVALWLLFLLPLVGLAGALVAGAWHWSWEVLAERLSDADHAWLAPVLALSPLFVVLWVVLLRLVALVLPPAGGMRRPLALWLGALGATLVAAVVVYATAVAMQSFVDEATTLASEEDAGEDWLRSLQIAIAPALVMGAFVTLGFSTMAWDRRPLLGALAFLAVPFLVTLVAYFGGGPPELLWASFGIGLVAGGLVVAMWARGAGLVWGVRILNGIASGAGAVLIAMLVGAGVWLIDEGRSLFGQDGEATREVFRGWLAAGSAMASVMVGAGLPRMASGGRTGKISRILFGFGGYFLLFSLAVLGAWAAWTVIDRNGSWSSLLLAGMFAAILVFPLALGVQRGVLLNVLSLSGVYEDRLQQTWIIGARPPRTERADAVPRWHRVWTRPDLTVTSLAAAEPVTPYPLICATLNIPGSRGDKLPERSSDSFVIAPVYSGSALSRWSPSSSMGGFADMSLARAASISGAAVAPNMGEKTSGTLSVLTTIFNVRTGRWVPNPRHTASRGLISRSLNAIPAVLYLRELLGNANRDDDFMYLSDGGHFENLGVYELFRRRCRYIVAVSSDIESIEGADALGNLGTALRMARVDFGVEVSIPSLKPLLRNPQTGRVLSYFAVGELRYGGAAGDGEEPPPIGTFVLIKTGLVEDSLTADLIQYLAGNPSFPYDSTLDQQFDQPQFESYRHLGYLAGSAMSLKASTWPEHAGPPPTGWPQPLAARFRALREDFDAVPSGGTAGRVPEAVDGAAASPPPPVTTA